METKCSPAKETIVVMRSGVFYKRVCSPFNKEETLRAVNEGKSAPKYGGVWSISNDLRGEPVTPCPISPSTHKHYMLDC